MRDNEYTNQASDDDYKTDKRYYRGHLFSDKILTFTVKHCSTRNLFQSWELAKTESSLAE